jgi:uncharacterized protein (TIGR02246 family)
MKKSTALLGIAAASYFAFFARSGESQTPATSDEQAIRQIVAGYGDAFNKGDLDALMAIWAPDAEYIDESGKVTKGRDGIAALFKKFLEDNKGTKMALEVTNVRPLKGDVALQDGKSTFTAPDGSTDQGRFTAVWFKSNGKWQIRSARDLPYAGGDVPGAGGPLKDLQWLIGEWEGDKGAVVVAARWMLGNAFLAIDYKVKEADGDLTVHQLVGFDPLTGQLKSWSFDSRGGYGEGLWTRDGTAWIVDIAGVLPDGMVGTAVNVLRRADDQTIVFESRDREIGGQPIPNSEVKLTRKGQK